MGVPRRSRSVAPAHGCMRMGQTATIRTTSPPEGKTEHPGSKTSPIRQVNAVDVLGLSGKVEVETIFALPP